MAGKIDEEAVILEKKIPVFTVLKGNSILKNIFLVDSPPSSSSSPIINQSEETLLVGRHPNCNITLEHPSISRFHLRIYSRPTLQSLSIIDLSSVHGTWILGEKIEPNVRVELKEGDTLRLGASTRIYKLHWVPLSRAYDLDNPLNEETEEDTNETHTLDSDDLNGLDLLFSEPIIPEDNPESPKVGPELQSGPSIWSRRGKHASVKIQTGRENEKSLGKDVDYNDEVSVSKNLFRCLNMDDNDEEEEEIDNFAPTMENEVIDESFRPSEENMTPKTPSPSKSMKKNYKQNIENLRFNNDECFTPDKENKTPLMSKSMKKNSKNQTLEEEIEGFTPNKENFTPNHKVSNSLNSKNQTCEEQIELFTPNKENFTPNSPKSSFSINGDEIYTPDKENITPNTSLSKPSKKLGKLTEIKHRLSISSPLKNVVGSTSSENKNQVLQEHKYTSLAPTKQARLILQEIAPKVPFQCLEEDHSQFKPLHKEENKNWTIVVDTASLLDKESRKALQLLQGLKCTNLIVPGIVMRELNCMKKRGSLFKRINEADLALKWIEECMNETKRWIHVQSVSEEVKSTALTPPVTPLSQFNDENKMIWNLFSPSISLMEILTPTREDHILECALLFRKSVVNGGFVLLSDDVTLKIKAMAEGLLCETAVQFRESLVNPFSERFLWSESSPKGLTWSYVDDVVLKEKYYYQEGPVKKMSSKSGLKLVLLHNSVYRLKNYVS